jgi:hypothetical protein
MKDIFMVYFPRRRDKLIITTKEQRILRDKNVIAFFWNG